MEVLHYEPSILGYHYFWKHPNWSFSKKMSAAWIITIEEQMESRWLVPLPAWRSRRSAKACKDVVLEKPNLEGPWFSLNKTFRNKNVQYIKLPNKIISMLWNIADKQQRMRPSSSKGRQSSKPRQKKQHHLFVEFLGIPDTDSVPEKGKRWRSSNMRSFPPFFEKNVGERRFLLIACCQICHILFSMLIWVTCGVAALPSFGWAEKTKIHIIHFTRGSRFERLFMCA